MEAALDVQWSLSQCEAQDETAWTILVIRVVLNNLTRCDGFTYFLYTNAAQERLVNRMLGKLELIAGNLAADAVNHHHTTSLTALRLAIAFYDNCYLS